MMNHPVVWDEKTWKNAEGVRIGDYYLFPDGEVWAALESVATDRGWEWTRVNLDPFDLWVLEQRQNREIRNNDSGS